MICSWSCCDTDVLLCAGGHFKRDNRQAHLGGSALNHHLQSLCGRHRFDLGLAQQTICLSHSLRLSGCYKCSLLCRSLVSKSRIPAKGRACPQLVHIQARESGEAFCDVLLLVRILILCSNIVDFKSPAQCHDKGLVFTCLRFQGPELWELGAHHPLCLTH